MKREDLAALLRETLGANGNRPGAAPLNVSVSVVFQGPVFVGGGPELPAEPSVELQRRTLISRIEREAEGRGSGVVAALRQIIRERLGARLEELSIEQLGDLLRQLPRWLTWATLVAV